MVSSQYNKTDLTSCWKYFAEIIYSSVVSHLAGGTWYRLTEEGICGRFYMIINSMN